MPAKFKLNACFVFLLAILFLFFFEFSKHDPILSKVNAFDEDPYDGVGSMGIQVAVLVATLSLLRSFWRHSASEVSESRKTLLVRTQMIAVLTVGITLAADIIAMLRHPSMWVGTAGGNLLAALLASMASLTLIAGWRVYRSGRRIALPRVCSTQSVAVAICVATVFILAFYPEGWRHSILGAIFTALIGGVLLFVPIWALERALVPYHEEIVSDDPATVAWSHLRKFQWTFIVLVGVVAGLLLVLRELHDPAGWPQLSERIVLVVSVYIGLETAGLVIGYSLLRKPLGLFLTSSPQK